ncbi:MAG: hypothetical protein OEY29_15260 [Gammaproteobacteria bacterium]|nr:hypothetical protein [Gammaproteobacteria bacterium]
MNILKHSSISLSYVLLLSLLASCSSLSEKDQIKTIFYPDAPSPPRIQYLASFSGPNDLIDSSNNLDSFLLGKENQASALLKKPYGVSIHDGVIYAVDTRGPGYAIFDLKKAKFDVVHGSFSGKMRKPINISIDKNGDKYITDTQRRLILVYDASNKFVRTIGDGESFTPSDVLIIKEKLYVTDVKNHIIRVLDKKSGQQLSTIGAVGSEEGQLFYPTNLALGVNNNIYVSETGNFRVQQFTQEGKFVASYGKVGAGVGHFARPKGIAIDREGRIHVVDAAFENVQVLNKDGQMLMFYGAPGGRRHNINLPTNIFIDYDHNAYFQKYAEPGFKLEYIILVASQFGPNKVTVFGYGKKAGFDYSENGKKTAEKSSYKKKGKE